MTSIEVPKLRTERGKSSENRALRATLEPDRPGRSACRTWPKGSDEAFFNSQEARLELSTIYAKGIYERHKMVYNLDPSRAFDTEVTTTGPAPPPGLPWVHHPSVGAYQRKPGPAAAPSLAESHHSALSMSAAPTRCVVRKREEAGLADALCARKIDPTLCAPRPDDLLAAHWVTPIRAQIHHISTVVRLDHRPPG